MSVYRQVLGDDFDRLAPELRRFHDSPGLTRFSGRCRIEPADGKLGRLLGALLRLPRAAEDAAFDFELTASAARETWVRRFPGRTMRSTLVAAAGRLVERIGPVSFWFDLKIESGALAMNLSHIAVLGLKWPRAWTPRAWGNERGGDGRLYFDAGACFPGGGLVTAYRGYLDVGETRS